MGADLSMCGQTRSYGYFFLEILSRSQSSRFSARIMPAIYSGASTGSPVSGSQVVLMVLSFCNGENNCSIVYPCSLQRYGPISTMRLWGSSQYFVGKVKLIFLMYVFPSTESNQRLVLYLEHWKVTTFLSVNTELLQGESSSYIYSLYSVAIIVNVWLCCFWHLFILSLVWQYFYLAMVGASLICALYIISRTILSLIVW